SSTNSNDITLDKSITLNGTLTLSSGDLNLNGSHITFGTSATLAENRMSGYVVKDNSGTGTIIVNNRAISGDIAGLGLGITNMGALNVNIIRGHSQQTGEAPDNFQGIKKWFNITVESGTVSSASLSFYYSDDDFAPPATSAEESYFKLYKKVGTSPWEGGFGTVNTTNNVVTHSGISSFSIWTVGTSNFPLPVTLVNFYAQPEKTTAHLFWQTAHEYENKGFEVQKSTDGLDFEPIGFVEGAINSATMRHYHFTDSAFFQDAYYRLKQIDIRGTSQLSKVIFVKKQTTDDCFFVAYPNPFQRKFNLVSEGTLMNTLSLQLLDVKGNVLFRERGTLKHLNECLASFSQELIQGMYLLHIHSEKGQHVLKIQKQ
ncbi:MAG: T9SS type A sorting domain-containing protein, partial [Flammeovirgaceae bacterium]|nr:T9SS type A sorting domain-containing protein [Flammeovirgaceae bacterium]MDW8288769.1 T9SS type A sorting domain-containing protein [Flammeovirgaceae bacterium]